MNPTSIRVTLTLALLALAAPVALRSHVLAGGTEPEALPAPIVDGQPTSNTALITAVGPISIVVGDLDHAVEWYTTVLDFSKVSEVEVAGDPIERLTGQFGVRCRVATLALGQERIELIDYLAPEGRAVPADSRSNDLWFQHIAIVVRDMDEAYAHLRRHNVRHASAGPQTLPDWNPGAGGISAFYFKDPDGHVLEVIHFPPAKGDPRWQRADAPLFMGIDHTAIVVEDTDASVAFYRDALGLRVAGAGENYGIEQERLNNVFGVRLRLTTLRAPSGPGIELLEYVAPGGGRQHPADSAMSDLWSWRTTLVTAEAARAFGAAADGGACWISPGVIDSPPPALSLDDAAMLRDPDGHALLLAQP